MAIDFTTSVNIIRDTNRDFNYIPTPKEILSEKDKYIDLMFQNIVSICEKIKTDNKNVLYSIIDSNDYLNYIQKVCNVNYKDYISRCFSFCSRS